MLVLTVYTRRMAKKSYASSVVMKGWVIGTNRVPVVASGAGWRLIGAHPTPSNHTIILGTSRNFTIATGMTLPSGTVDLVMPVTWFLWPPGVEMWANAAVATDVLHITELPLPENFVGVAVGLTVAS